MSIVPNPSISCPKLIFYVGTPDYLCDPYSSRELPIGPQEPAWLPHYSMPCFYPLPATLMRTRYMTNSVDFYHVKIEHGYGSMEGLGLKAEHWEIENNQVFDNASGKGRKQMRMENRSLWAKNAISVCGFISLWRPHVFLQGYWWYQV